MQKFYKCESHDAHVLLSHEYHVRRLLEIWGPLMRIKVVRFTSTCHVFIGSSHMGNEYIVRICICNLYASTRNRWELRASCGEFHILLGALGVLHIVAIQITLIWIHTFLWVCYYCLCVLLPLRSLIISLITLPQYNYIWGFKI